MNQALVLKNLEQAILEGKLSRAKKGLTSYLSEVPNKERDHSWKYAELCRRIGRHDWSLKLLTPYVRPSEESTVIASAEENLEYAAALILSGAPEEALRLIKNSSAKDLNKSNLIKAYYHQSKWNFQKATQDLNSFLKNTPSTHYERLNAEALLLSYHVNLELWPEAKDAQKSLQMSSAHYPKIYANSCLLGAKIAIAEKDWSKASDFLNEANLFFSKSKHSFFSEKWTVLINSFKNSFSNTTELINLQRKATQLQKWDELREIDLYTAKANNDSWLYSKLYYGTPHQKFKDKIVEKLNFQETPGQLKEPFVYHLDAYNNKQTANYTLCPYTGQNSFSGEVLKQGQVLQKLLETLFSDLYTPQSTISLFAKIYPKQNFNQKNSANQIHQILHRLRSWTEKSKIPLTIKHQKNSFHCEASSPVAITFSKTKPVDSTLMKDRNTLFKQYQDDYFKSSDIATTLNISQRHATRLVKQLIGKKLLSSYGVGRRTRYFFKE